MKKLLLFAAIASCSVSLISCGNAQTDAAQTTTAQEPTPTIATSSTVSQPDTTPTKPEAIAANPTSNRSSNLPEIATVRQLKLKYSSCTLTLEDTNNQRFTIPTSLATCDNQSTFLNQKVRPVYEQGTSGVIVTSLELVSAPTSDSQTLTNGQWTITIGNLKAWSGVNNTGNATYRGCDAQGKCIRLTQGKTTARNGVVVTAWQNGDYTYAVQSPISDRPTTSGTTLTVRQGGTEILRETGFQTVSQ